MTSNESMVGVVIPMFNAEGTIGATLESVCQQTYGKLEIIVVNDGSMDRSVSIVKSYANKDARIRLVHQDNSGVASARNAGAASTSAQFLAFIDADDLWAPAKIELQMEVMEASGDAVGIIYCWHAGIDKDGRVGSAFDQSVLEGKVLRDLCIANFIGAGSSVLLRRSAFEAAGGYDQSLRARNAQGCEDFLMNLRIAEQYEFRVVPKHLVGYRTTNTNMSSDVMQMCRSCELVIAEYQMKCPQYKRELDHQMDEILSWLVNRALAAGKVIDAARLMKKLVAKSPRKASVSLATLVPWGARACAKSVLKRYLKVRPLYTDKIW